MGCIILKISFERLVFVLIPSIGFFEIERNTYRRSGLAIKVDNIKGDMIMTLYNNKRIEIPCFTLSYKHIGCYLLEI